jgi:O-antigen ligase
MFSLSLTYAYSFGIVASFAFAAFLLNLTRGRWYSVLYLICVGTITLSILTSFTRGAWIAISIAFAVMVGMVSRTALWAYFTSALLITGGLAAFLDGFSERLASIFDLNMSSNLTRLHIWAGNFEIFKEYPILGIGYGENEYALGEYYIRAGIPENFVGHSHNNYLQFLAGTGALGLAAYLGLIIVVFVISLRLWRRIPESEVFFRTLTLGAIGAQIVIHTGGFTECNFKDFEVNHMFVTLMSLIVVVASHYRVQQTLLPINQPNSKH